MYCSITLGRNGQPPISTCWLVNQGISVRNWTVVRYRRPSLVEYQQHPPESVSVMPHNTSSQSHGTITWILLSGGIDSTACLAFYLKQNCHVECFHISFGQPASRNERLAATRVARHYDVPLTVLRWSGSEPFTAGEIVGRNAFFLFGALVEIRHRSGILATGIHAGTPYFDTTPNFLTSLQAVFDGYCDGRIRLAAPFIGWSKDEIYLYCKSESIPIDLTYSCEEGLDRPCGTCLSCEDRRLLDVL